MKSRITGVSRYIPENLVTNADLEQKLKSSNPTLNVPKDIVEITTGIKSRYFANDNEYNSSLASYAVQKLFNEHNVDPKSIDLLIYASAGQDQMEPATSHIIQNNIGTNARVMDIKNACNSFVNALEVANAFINAGIHKKIIIACGEVSSKSVKWNLKDRNDFKRSFPGYTLGDGGAAVLVEAENEGIFYSECVNDSTKWEQATLAGGGTRNPRGEDASYFQGDGGALKSHFEAVGPYALNDFLKKNNIKKESIDHILIHQASYLYLEDLIKILGIDRNKIVNTIQEYGNLAAVTLPFQLSILKDEGKLKQGDTILMIGMAAGISLELVYLNW